MPQIRIKVRVKVPTAVYAAVRKSDGQVLGTDTNKAELKDRVNPDVRKSDLVIIRYVRAI